MRCGLLAALVLGACTPAGAPQRPASPAGEAAGEAGGEVGGEGIVSLNPCTDAILAEVADPAQIAALSAFSRDPAASSMDVKVARRFPATSGTVEEIATLRPALIVSGTFTPPATRRALAGLGIPLIEVPIAGTVAESTAQVRQIARLAGHPERGEALIGRIEAALRQAAPPAGLPVSALVWQSGGIVPGNQTLIVDLLRRTGFASFSGARGLRQADYLPLESILADPPGVILAAGGKGEEDRLLAHPALRRLANTVRAPFDPALLWCGGPTIIRAAARLAEVRRALGRKPSPGSDRAEPAAGPAGRIPLGLSRPQPRPQLAPPA